MVELLFRSVYVAGQDDLGHGIRYGANCMYMMVVRHGSDRAR